MVLPVMNEPTEVLSKRKLHFHLKTKDYEIAYCYIRKNGCSSWKRFFAAQSPRRSEAASYPNLIGFMGKYHKIKTTAALSQIQDRIVILRDPIDRFFSAFVNQFAMRLNRRSCLHDLVRAKLNRPLEAISLSDFVYEYLLQSSPSELDGHFWSQTSHLSSVEYKHMWMLGDMFDQATHFFGSDIANSFFLKPRNSTSHFKRTDDFSHLTPCKDFYHTYAENHILPSQSSLLEDSILEALKYFYSDDYATLDKSARLNSRPNYIIQG